MSWQHIISQDTIEEGAEALYQRLLAYWNEGRFPHIAQFEVPLLQALALAKHTAFLEKAVK